MRFTYVEATMKGNVSLIDKEEHEAFNSVGLY